MPSGAQTVLFVVSLASLLAGLANAADPADLGARLYAERCSACHGDEGRGDGPTAPALVPKPRNFRDPALWAERTIEQMRDTVRHGKPGTMMPPFEGVLTDEEIAAVVDHVSGFKPHAASAK
jgi:high-affinity iron transporter